MRAFRPWAILIACTLTLASCARWPCRPLWEQPVPGTAGRRPTHRPPADTTGTPADTTGTPPPRRIGRLAPVDAAIGAGSHRAYARGKQRGVRLAPPGVAADAAASDAAGPTPLLLCQPLEYDGAAAIIGPEGGELRFGPHRLTIPSGALLTRTVVTAEAPTSLMVTADFSPHGLQFQKDVELRLDYEHCTQPLLPGAFRVVYLDNLLKILETPPSEDYRSSQWIRTWLRHFSKYAVAY